MRHSRAHGVIEGFIFRNRSGTAAKSARVPPALPESPLRWKFAGARRGNNGRLYGTGLERAK